jgi:formamidopyrimidine-DNA glycosylase
MPELPEVETFKRYFDSTSLNQVIQNVTVNDDRVLLVSEILFKESLIGGEFENTIRHGKYFLAQINSKYLVFHFGMTGDLVYYSSKDPEPKYGKVIFQFDNGHSLAYISSRMFGKLDIVASLEELRKKKKLGPDAFKMNYQEFIEAIKKRTAIMKSALLNQSIISGVGNIYSDEILFRSGIHPKRKINSLNEVELEKLFKNTKDILSYGIEKKGELELYSDSFLIPHRAKEEHCPNCGNSIERYEISGRHGFFCNKCQK